VDNDIAIQLGRRVAALRGERGLSQQDLAERSGLTVEAVSRIERATREPRITTVGRIAAGLQVSMAELVDFEVQANQRRHRPDVEAIASLLDSTSEAKVAFIARFAKLLLDERDNVVSS
jgi:transcriptional regulator with XRE-family HTH domain